MPQGTGHLIFDRAHGRTVNLQSRVFWLPKAGNAVDEYEDAFFAPKRARGDKPFVCAIADGATESLLSRQWANLLVRRFAQRWLPAHDWRVWLQETHRAWQSEKREYLERRERTGKPVQWYEEPGLEAGAFAALLGLVLTRAHDHWVWRAAAMGDCCLMQVRAEECVCAFPMQDASAFNNRPFLLSSNPARNGDLQERWCFAEGRIEPGDRIYLMTDALAAWSWRANEAGAHPWDELDAHLTPDAFAAWTTEQRATHVMRNDDVTCIALNF